MIELADVNMDNINIEIQSSSEKATQGVNSLIETLNSLNSALSNTQNNINKFLINMNKIANIGKKMNLPTVSNNKNLLPSKELIYLNSGKSNNDLGGQSQKAAKNIENSRKATQGLKINLGELGQIAGKISNRIGSMFKSLAKAGIANVAIKTLNNGFNSLGKGVSSVGARVRSLTKTLAIYAAGVFGIRSAFYAIKNSTNEFLSSQNAVAQQLSANISYLKYAIGASLAPVIEFLTNLVYSLLRAIQALVYMFAKVNIFANASAKSMSSGAGSAGKTTKELQKQLQVFDELNNINLDKGSSGGGGGGGGGISPDFDLSEIDESFKYLFDDIDNWGKNLAEKINNALSKIDWNSILAGAENAATRLANILNDFTYYLDFDLLGYSIAQGFNTVLTFIDTFFQKYDWSQLGHKLAEGLNSVVNTLQWDRFGRTLTDGLRAAILTLEGFVVDFDFKNLGQKIGEMVISGFRNIPWNKAANAINVGVTGILDTIITFLDTVPWDEVGQKIGKFLNDINWTEIIGKAFEVVGKIGAGLVETLWNTMFSGSDTVILGILGATFAIVKTGLLENLIPEFEKIAPKAKALLGEHLGDIFRVAVGIVLVVDSLKTSFDKALNKDVENGLSVQNLAKNLGGGLEAGLGALMITKNVKVALLVAIGKVSFDTGIDIGTEINKIDWVQEEYTHYIDTFNIDTEENGIVKVIKGIGAALGTLGDAILNLPLISDWWNYQKETFSWMINTISNIGGTIQSVFSQIPTWLKTGLVGEPMRDWWNEKIAPWFTIERWQQLANNAKAGIENKFYEFKDNFKPIQDWWNEKIAPWFVSTKWEQIANDAKTGIENKFNDWKSKFHPVQEWWNEKIAPWFTVEKWQQIANNAKVGIENKFNDWKSNYHPVRDWWNEKIAPWFTVEKWQQVTNNAKTGIERKFNDWKNNYHPVRDWWNNKIAPWFTTEKWRQLGQSAVQGIQNAFSNFSFRIRLPHFSWSSQPASGWMANVLSALNLPTSLPKLHVSWYAQGGFPDAGDLFVANEAGAEMVGSIGNKTAVANNDQITRAIADATYQAISQALSESNEDGQPIVINIGNETLYKGFAKNRSQASNQYGITV